MSSDSQAMIYYGFPVSAEEVNGFGYRDLNSKWEKERRPTSPSLDGGTRTAEWYAWRESLHEWKATVENIEIDFSGSDQFPEFYVHAFCCQLKVEWGTQLSLRGYDFGPRPEADVYLKQFCELFGIEWKEPRWHLAARYF